MTIRSRLRARRYAALVLLDQSVWTGSNFVLTVVTARSLTTAEFGAFSFSYIFAILVIGLVSSGVGEQVAVHHVDESDAARRSTAQEAIGFAFAFGALAGLLALAVSAVVAPELSPVMRLFAFAIVPLAVQEAWRGLFLGTRRPQLAAVNDGVWAVVQFGSLWGFATMDGELSVADAVLAWGLGALTGSILGAWQERVLPRPARAWGWWRRHRVSILSYSTEYVLRQWLTQAVGWIVGITSGVRELGILRAAQVTYGPVALAFVAFRAGTIPQLRGQVREGDPGVRRRVVRSALVLGAGVVLWGLALQVVPGMGPLLVGVHWREAADVANFVGLQRAGAGIALGFIVGLRALALRRESTRIIVATSVATIAGGLVGARVAGALGAAVALAIAAVLPLPLWWATFSRALTRERSRR